MSSKIQLQVENIVKKLLIMFSHLFPKTLSLTSFCCSSYPPFVCKDDKHKSKKKSFIYDHFPNVTYLVLLPLEFEIEKLANMERCYEHKYGCNGSIRILKVWVSDLSDLSDCSWWRDNTFNSTEKANTKEWTRVKDGAV